MFLRRRNADPVGEIVDRLVSAAGRGRVAWSQRAPAEAPRFAEPARPLPPRLRQALGARGIERLYAHQVEALDQIRAGRDTVIVTPTASGKTLGFTLPIVERLLTESGARALYLYPTNALVNDQERGLRGLLDALPGGPTAATLTGATDNDTRRALRRTPPEILLTNPEMLHMSLLGQHRYWERFWPGLRYIVFDEMHLYRGLFGAHMAMVARRALRVAALYGAEPLVIGCSATVGNPAELGERLLGRPVRVVRGSGAGRGPRTFMVWQPPLLRGAGAGERASAQNEAVNLFCTLVEEGLGTILFALTRRGAEAMSIEARQTLGPALAGRVAPYRSGYTPTQRRLVEEQLKSGELLGVISTNALEVGIDIGGLDAAVIAGFPGSRTSFWQQAGRAGRGERGALVAFVPYPRAVDGYYAAHPEALLAGTHEDAIVDLGNARVLAAHLACAAREVPLRPADPAAFAPAAADAAHLALADGRLAAHEDGLIATQAQNHTAVGLRGAAGAVCRIVGPTGELGTIDEAHFFLETHPGAIYLHNGQRFRVRALDRRHGRVEVTPEPALLLTEPVVQTVVHAEPPHAERAFGPGGETTRLFAGALTVRRTTISYREIHPYGRTAPVITPLAEPLTYELATAGLWAVFPPTLRRRLDAAGQRRFFAGLHALEHVLPAAVSLRVLCDARDVIATFEEDHATLGGPALFLYDDYAGGAGVAERLLPDFAELLRLSLAIVRDCACRDGCPACILSVGCWRPFDEPDKSAAIALLGELVGGGGAS